MGTLGVDGWVSLEHDWLYFCCVLIKDKNRDSSEELTDFTVYTPIDNWK